ncbi:MAG: hypothetical protein CSA96_09440 [Bacteroidetes bacterium]|nr:MAG: hypothetical protein CSA96_09440 [Bacteroidota bacterium]
MSPKDLLLLQFIAHLLSDFVFQPEKRAREKNKGGFKSGYIKTHILLTFLFSWLLSFQWLFVIASLSIALSHWLIDGFKPRLNAHRTLARYTFLIDQVLHLGFLALITLGFLHFFPWQPVLKTWIIHPILPYLAGFLLCAKPSNILVRELLRANKISFESSYDLPNAGRLIGILERLLVLTFILLNQFSAIGFLIAAKSILRFRDSDKLKTEYVLIGTLLSFAIAIAVGLGINALIRAC